MDITVSPLLQQVATPEDFATHIDIADWLIRCNNVMLGSDRATHSRSFLKVARFLDPELADDVEGLLEELGLEYLGVERVIDEAPP